MLKIKAKFSDCGLKLKFQDNFKAKFKCYNSRASFKTKFEGCNIKISFKAMFKDKVYGYI
jgi:hypothetical protein